jgi:hypothetical protein
VKKRLLTASRGKLMGLDQFAYLKDDSGNQSEIAYWRKHPNLQGWMEKLFASKGGTCESFNGVEVELTSQDLSDLRSDIVSDSMKKLDTSGFFFGSPSDDHYRDYDLDFIANARLILLAGGRVFYNSSW